MSDQLGWAESNLDDTSSTIGAVLAYAKRINDETDDVSARLRALFRQDKREDPVRDREMKNLTQALIDQIDKDKALVRAVLANQPLDCKIQGKAALELTEEDGQEAFEGASRVIREREELKNYK